MPGSISFVDNGDGTGTFSGTPSASEAGVHAVSIVAENPYGYEVRNMAFNLKGAPTEFRTSDTLNLGPGNSFVRGIEANGFPLPRFTKTGALPHGVHFNRAEHTISGTPTDNSVGTYTIEITAKNKFGSLTQTMTINVTPGGGDQ
jgi:hypothetical protein